LFGKARLPARAFVAASLIGAAGGVGVGAAYLAGVSTADVAQKPVVIPIAAATRATLAYAASQHLSVPQLRGPLSAASSVNPALLQAAAFQASAPFRLANPDAAAHDLDCLTAAVYYEARGESREGQAAVAQVVLNRVRSPAFPKTVCGVVYQGAAAHSCQFSFACDGQAGAHREGGAWDRARSVATRALGGYVMSGVGGATHFHVASLGAVWGGGMVRIAQVGQHVFYGFGGHRGAIPVDVVTSNSRSGEAPAQAQSDAPAVADKPVDAPTAVAATSPAPTVASTTSAS
jgi:spore germination cell wall hydrolase CwlJ-like protein